jgi:hypothetical protein
MCDEDSQKGQFICSQFYAKADIEKNGKENAEHTAYGMTSQIERIDWITTLQHRVHFSKNITCL